MVTLAQSSPGGRSARALQGKKTTVMLDPQFDVHDAPPSTAAEDFVFMLQKVLGRHIWLGAARTGYNPGLHSPHRDFSYELLPYGVAFWVSLMKRLWLLVDRVKVGFIAGSSQVGIL
ncbi:MAG: hypothetical protein K8F25_07085 [Fimbriimonadaceae bacterium]|nr:hypothetical protein [Alphaproteobacteria bacterium]